MNPVGVSTALYGWTERFARDGVEWDWGTLYGACKEAGVGAIETDPTDEQRAVLDRLGLPVSASYVGLGLRGEFADIGVDANVLPVARRLADAGGDVLIVNSDPAEWGVKHHVSASEIAKQGENLSRIADLIAPLGLRLALHNHADDYDTAASDLESVVAHADETVGLCIDTDWAMAAGHDPIEWAREHSKRVSALHLRNRLGTVPAESLGEGDLDVAAFLAALPDYTGWLTLELWHPDTMTPRGSMVQAVRESTDLLRRLTAR